VVDPELNARFAAACESLGVPGDCRRWNVLLFNLRKQGRLAQFATTRRTAMSWEACDRFLFASEIAWEKLLEDERASSLDEILCDPALAADFDAIARRYAPGFTSLDYRWAALKLRKQTEIARNRGSRLRVPSRLGKATALDAFKPQSAPESPGVYVLSGLRSRKLYVGEAVNLRQRLAGQFENKRRRVWREESDELFLQVFPTQSAPAEMLAWQSCFVRKFKPRLNLRDLQAAP
jgi:hypothetical protein